MEEILQVLMHLDDGAQRRVTSWLNERIARDGGIVLRSAPAPEPDRHSSKPRALVELADTGTEVKLVARTLGELLQTGVIRPGEPIEWRRPSANQHFKARIVRDGVVVTADGRSFSSLSTAAGTLAGGSYNGWTCWTVPRLGGVTLGSLRSPSSGRLRG